MGGAGVAAADVHGLPSFELPRPAALVFVLRRILSGVCGCVRVHVRARGGGEGVVEHARVVFRVLLRILSPAKAARPGGTALIQPPTPPTPHTHIHPLS